MNKKKIGPPTLNSRPRYPFLTHSPSPQSKIRNTLKFKKKKNFTRAKPTASLIDYRGSSLMASPRILNQKKNQYKESEMKPITSLAEKSNPNTVYTEQKQNKL